jgi:cytochrome c oxidase assembly factor CtaG
MPTLLSYGVPAPSLGGVATAWRLDPLALLVVLGLAAGYLAGVRRVSARSRTAEGPRWPAARTAAFFGLGLTGLTVVSMGWPAAYAPELFSVYAVQVTMIMLVVPFLLALGRPISLAKAALGDTGRARLEHLLASRPARFFTVPVVSPLLLAVAPFLIFFTPLYRLTLTQPGLLPVLHLVLLVIGLGVLVPLWEADTIAARFPYAVALLFAFVELLLDAVPGIIIRLDTHVIAAGYFAALARPWGPSPLHDQQLGGDLLWCVGEAIDVPFLALLVVQWIRSDARDAARIDHALDAADARPLAASGADPDADPASPDGTERPWWEQDASVFGDRADQYRR